MDAEVNLDEGPDYTNRDFRFRRLVTKFAVRARRKFYSRFLDFMQPEAQDTIIDVGVTPDSELEDSNFLEKWYPHPEEITATSIEDASNIENFIPGVTFVRTEGRRLPFEDKQFAIAFSTAVVEHVGDRESQMAFVSEMLRVGNRFFITTPNRWYPLEIHTFLPFLHWLPRTMHQRILRALGKNQWATTENLNLLSKKQLLALFPPGAQVQMTTVRTFGMSSNLIVYG